MVFVQYQKPQTFRQIGKLCIKVSQRPFFFPHKLTLVALEIYISAEGIFCFIVNVGTQIKRENYFTAVEQTKDHTYLAIHHCSYHVIKIYSHTNIYIHKWCSSNLFRYFEYKVLQKKNMLNYALKGDIDIIDIYHFSYYVIIDSFKI